VDSVEALRRSFAAAEDRRLPAAPAAAYAFTMSALDDTLAPSGHHTIYLACPAAPFRIDEGWGAAGSRLAEDLIDQVEARAPGFRDSIQDVHIRTPADMAAELRWPGAHPMYLDLTPDRSRARPARPPRVQPHRGASHGAHTKRTRWVIPRGQA
jgi:phytoene dehydrogenase-like protein